MARLSGGLNICVLASGEGSNLKAILKARNSKKIKSRVSLVISNNSSSGALKIARRNNIAAYHLSQKQFNSEKQFVDTFLALLKRHKIDLIVLAGYMKMLSPRIIRKYRNKILNIHPALLPAFGGKGMYGMNVHNAVLASGEKISGASVHIVDEEYDNGPVVIQKPVKISENETAQSLQKKVLRIEHKIYPEAIKLFEAGKIKIRQGRVIILK